MGDCIKFADFIAYISFLRTIPAPVFNSEVSICGLNGSIVNLSEDKFNVPPNKNTESIKVLIECLGF